MSLTRYSDDSDVHAFHHTDGFIRLYAQTNLGEIHTDCMTLADLAENLDILVAQGVKVEPEFLARIKETPPEPYSRPELTRQDKYTCRTCFFFGGPTEATEHVQRRPTHIIDSPSHFQAHVDSQCQNATPCSQTPVTPCSRCEPFLSAALAEDLGAVDHRVTADGCRCGAPECPGIPA